MCDVSKGGGRGGGLRETNIMTFLVDIKRYVRLLLRFQLDYGVNLPVDIYLSYFHAINVDTCTVTTKIILRY